MNSMNTNEKTISASVLPSDVQTPELNEKKKTLDGIVTAIALYNRLLDFEEKSKVDELQDRMDFRLKELVHRSKLDEIDIKIDIMQKILDLVKPHD